MKRIIVIIAFVSCIASTGAFAAPASTPTSTPTPTDSAEEVRPIHGDDDLVVVSTSYYPARDQFRVVFRTDVEQSVTITTPPNSNGRGSIVEREITDGRTAVLVESPTSKVWVTTEESRDAGYFTELDAGGPSLIPEAPYDGNDLLAFGGGVAVTVGLAVLMRAAAAKLGLELGGERVDV